MKRAKALRSDQTEAEKRLWYYLRAERFMGLKLKRQKPIGPYIVDFVWMGENRLGSYAASSRTSMRTPRA